MKSTIITFIKDKFIFSIVLSLTSINLTTKELETIKLGTFLEFNQTEATYFIISERLIS